MSANTGALDVGPVDNIVNAIRRLLERVAPWFDPAEEAARRRETERVRRRSMAARLRVEDIVARYEHADHVVRK